MTATALDLLVFSFEWIRGIGMIKARRRLPHFFRMTEFAVFFLLAAMLIKMAVDTTVT